LVIEEADLLKSVKIIGEALNELDLLEDIPGEEEHVSN